NAGYESQRSGTVAGARETVGSSTVQKSRIQCYNCKEYGHVARECQKPKRAKDAAYHREKMLLCKQEEAGIQLNAEQADWKDDTDDQELEAHYMYMAKIQELYTDYKKSKAELQRRNTIENASEMELECAKVRGSRGTDLYSITLQSINSPNPICLMAKATSSQAWLWHHRLSHLNFDTINLLSKNDIVVGLPKLKYIKDHLCCSCELGKAKRKKKASVQISSDPAPECQTMALENNSLSPRRKCQENVSHGDKTDTTSNELDLLFSLMFDELLNGSSKVVSKSFAVSAADAPYHRQQLTTPLNNHTTPAPTSEPHAENEQVADDEFINIFSTLFTPSGYKWKPKSGKENVNLNVSMPLGNASRTVNVMDTMTSRRSTVSNTPLSSNSFVTRRDCPIHHRLWVLKAHDGKSQASS
nr:Gag-Pol polyprotein [Tanacetum cinerariifolium]